MHVDDTQIHYSFSVRDIINCGEMNDYDDLNIIDTHIDPQIQSRVVQKGV